MPLLENHFGVLSLEGFGLAGKPAAASAAGAILYYIRSTQRGTLDHVDRIGFYERQNCLVLDAVTVRNLELIEPLFAGTDAGVTLFRALDSTVTPMGKRLLRAWMLRPSIDQPEIEARLDAVEAQVKDLVRREELRRALEGILDLERLLSRVTLETANPRDVLALAASLAKDSTGAQRACPACSAARLGALHRPDRRTRRSARQNRAARSSKSRRLTLSDGGVIAPGVDNDLDHLRDLSRNRKQYLAQVEQRERERTGIGSLKVKFNSVFGYYIEISKANLHLAPTDYERKQTLVNAERFTTPELKEYESKILDAQEKIVEIERRLFAELRSAIAGEAKRIRQTALALAEVDVLASLAHVAALRNYCRPQVHRQRRLEDGSRETWRSSKDGIRSSNSTNWRRAAIASSPTILFLNSSTHNIVVLTGPNMGGKSTYLRQAALIVIHGADGIVRSGPLSASGHCRSRLHPHRRQRQSGPRTLHVYGRDDRDGGHPAHRHAAVADPARRSRTRHRHLRRPRHRLGRGRISAHPRPRQDSLRHSLFRADRISRTTQRRKELPCIGKRNRRRRSLSPQSRTRRGGQELRNRSRQACGTAE